MKPTDFEPNGFTEGVDDHAWPDFYGPVLMSCSISLLNDGTLISMGYDYVKPSNTLTNGYPFCSSYHQFCICALASSFSCIGLLIAGVEWYVSTDRHWWSFVWTNSVMIYLKVSISDFLTLFIARTHDGYFCHTNAQIFCICSWLCLNIIHHHFNGVAECCTDGIYTIGQVIRSLTR